MRRFIHIFAALALAACTNDLEFKMASQPEELLLSGQLKTTAQTHTIFAAVGNSNTLRHAPDLRVLCYLNGEPVWAEKWVPDPMLGYNSIEDRYTFSASLKPGDTVRITASSLDGEYTAIAESVVPARPSVASVDTVTVSKPATWDPKVIKHYLKIDLTLDDPAGKNWYMLQVRAKYHIVLHAEGHPDKEVDEERIPAIDSGEDPVLSEGVVISNEELFGTVTTNTYHIFSDAIFDGGKGETSFKLDYSELSSMMNVPVSNAEWDEDGNMLYKYDGARVDCTLDVDVYALPQDEYNYLKALGIRSSGFFFEDFMEPTAIPDNVEGATGFIGVMCGDTRSFKLPERIIEFEYTSTDKEFPDPS